MKKSLLFLAVAGFALSSQVAVAAENDFYVGIAASSYKSDVSNNNFFITEDLDGESKTIGELRFGKMFSKNFGIEASISASDVKLNKTSSLVVGANTAGISESIKYKPSFALYAKGNVDISDQFSLYGLLGLARDSYETTQCVNTVNGIPVSGFCQESEESGTKASFGLGVSYRPAQNLEIDLSYRTRSSLEIKDSANGSADVKFSSFSLGLNYRF